MKAFYSDGKVTLHQADVLLWALWYRGEIDAGRAEPFHAILTDAPYSLGDPPPIVPLLQAWLAGDNFDGFSSGFMQKVWDVLPGPQVWRALLDVCFPGAYMFVFGGTRTADLLGISCRLGGWEPFDRIASFAWVQGQGMKKGQDIGKALDKNAPRAGMFSEFAAHYAERRRGAGLTHAQICEAGKFYKNHNHGGASVNWERGHNVPTFKQWDFVSILLGLSNDFLPLIERAEAEREIVGINPHGYTSHYGSQKSKTKDIDITAAATPLAQAFDGYGTGIAPKHEPILLFRKPREGRAFAKCAREFGSGGLNIGATRVKTSEPVQIRGSAGMGYSGSKEQYELGEGRLYDTTGRWPPNTHFSHVSHHSRCPTCHGAGFVPAEPLKESFKSWYARTKDYGGTKEEWERLRDPGGTQICDECHGRGAVGGCRRVGSKRVRSPVKSHKRNAKTEANFYGRGLGEYPIGYSTKDYADADGREEVADWECVEGCAVRAVDEMAGERKSGGKPGVKYNTGCDASFGNIGKGGSGRCIADTGSASRFFVCHDWSYEIAERLAGETPCPICLTQTPKHSTMNEMQRGSESCENASGVTKNLSQKDESNDFAQEGAPLSGHQESAGKSESSNIPADSVVRNLTNTQETSECTVQKNAPIMPDEQLAQIVKSAGSLCEKCTTAFVQSLVLMLQEKDRELHHGQDSTTEYKLCTLIHNLVSSVEIQKPLDITQIIQSPMLLSGFVTHVITGFIERKKADQNLSWSHDIGKRLAGTIPFLYNAKASRGEREAGCKERPRKFLATMGDGIGEREHSEDEPTAWVGNNHPTVKPLSLCKWLAALACPPPQFNPRIAVPFCGSSSEIIGAILAGGWAEIHGIEQELEYCEISAARIAWWTKWVKHTGKDDPAAIRKLGESAEAKEAWQDNERQKSMFDLLQEE